MLMHGMNHFGINDQRVQHLAKALVSVGYRVILPEINEIKNLKVNALQAYEDFFELYFQERQERVKLFLISFSGGLAINAISRRDYGEYIDAIIAVGGFSDFKKTINYANKNYLYDDYALNIVFYNYYQYIHRSEKIKKYFYDSLIFNSLNIKNDEYLKTKNDLSKIERLEIDRLKLDSHYRFEICKKIIFDNMDFIYQLSPINHCHLLNKRIKINILHGNNDKIISKEESVNLFFSLNRTHRVNLFLTDLISHGDNQSMFSNLLDVPKIANFFNNFLKD